MFEHFISCDVLIEMKYTIFRTEFNIYVDERLLVLLKILEPIDTISLNLSISLEFQRELRGAAQ